MYNAVQCCTALEIGGPHIWVLLMLAMLSSIPPMHYTPPPQPPVVPPPLVIDPQLQQSEENLLNPVLQRLQNLKEFLKQPHDNEDSDADDKGDGGTKWHRKKLRKDSKFILNIKTSQLTPAQKTTRAKLQDCVHIAIYNLTGIIASEIGKP
ncbi:hypothetical protein BDR07DRAFT_1563759 [Suillus spraguei]|nr:hypothetical protein BDR07DRAFT_1563759 [Suillus spraguei]